MYQGFSYSELSDIVQLDGPADNSDVEGENGAPLEENDFLGIINAEAIKALQEGDGSSEGNSISSSSDSEGADELANVEEEVRERERESHVFSFPHWGSSAAPLSFRNDIYQSWVAGRTHYLFSNSIALMTCSNSLFPLTFSLDKDPLNSGDDVIEQDIPDLFDTDNVIVCQYDKVRKSLHWP